MFLTLKNLVGGLAPPAVATNPREILFSLMIGLRMTTVTLRICGLFDAFSPKYVKQYAAIGAQIRQAVEAYRDEVKKGQYPDKTHSFD